jgi:uncharacterized membrane-anchored protein YhcB (DUF1043 family)
VFSLATLLITAVTTFIIGGLLSLLLTRSFSSNEQKTRTLESRVEEAEASLANYQQEVTEHFAETAQLVNNLTQNYKEVHEHLAGSALKLANVDISRQMLSTQPDNEEGELTINEETFQPPKDWAPSEGTLSEDYGLNDTDDTQNPSAAKA